MDMPMIEVNNVSMRFNQFKERVDSLKEYLIRIVRRNLKTTEFWALKEISFTIGRGESWGLIGVNGSGKSTLLKLIASVLKPTEGSVVVNGTIAPMIELGAGFDIDLTARENIYLNGAFLGFSRRQMAQHFDDIVDFSELHDFLDIPIKNYSSGMLARLGFSIATVVDPDILLIDEILSVGDLKFQKKCEGRIQEMIDSQATILFVSHSIEQILTICDKVIWLDQGRIRLCGDAQYVCDEYVRNML